MDKVRPHGRDEAVAAVLDAAEHLFAERGPALVTLRDIADEAQVNVGLIHRHIGSKDALIRAVIDRFQQQGLDRVGAIDTWDDLVALVFTPTNPFSHYTHLLAWLLLEGVDPAGSSVAPSPLDVLVAWAEGQLGAQARDELAALLAMAYGWQVFSPYLTTALRYDAEQADDVRQRLAALASQLSHPPR